jgi:glutamine amidotransferase
VSRIAVVDLGTGNLHSVSKALECVAPNQEVVITRDPIIILDAGHVVVPGQGAIGSWFRALDALNLRNVVTDVLSNRPVLGICLGLQALYTCSEEDGGVDGFDWMTGNVRRFPIDHGEFGQTLKVPHMGWNNVRQTASHPLWQGISDDSRFYFVHSYYVYSGDDKEIVGTTVYGFSFISAAAKSNIFAVQFHPEKSHNQGLTLLQNFVRWDGTI